MISARDYLIKLAYKYDNDWNKVCNALSNKEDVSDIPIKIAMFENKHSADFITLFDEEYPNNLENFTFKPPFVIYYKGDISELNRTDYYYLVGDNKFGIPSSDLITFDKTSKWLKVGNNLSLKTNDNTPNDILKVAVFLSKAIVVTKELTTVPITITLAAGTNKDVFVVPTLEPSRNNRLIKEGAYLLDSKEDLGL